MNNAGNIYDTILNMSYSYFSETKATPDSIREFIEMMKRAYGNDYIDEDLLFNKIEASHSIVIGKETFLDDNTDHENWFNPATNTGIKREIPWHFWDHYKGYLTSIKGWPPNIVDSIDSMSSEILSRIEDPQKSGTWDRRGMVMGSVQSGKTANYTALITKAADAGYKLFIVMAGVHNSLRSQTQSRINEEFLGYDLDKVEKLTGGEKPIGVRQRYNNHKTVYTLTSSNEKGDFKTTIANQIGIFPSNDAPPIVLVVKKHTTILENVLRWCKTGDNHGGNNFTSEIPVFIIDDECDYASVNTKKPKINPDTGRPVEEWDPTKTNRLIRELLSLFDKSIYLGYTATPYANIFIHKDHTHEKYGEDIFPKSFIMNLPKPSNYLGAEDVFGLKADSKRNIEEIEALPLTRPVEDHSHIIPDKHKITQVIETLPESMKKAIKSFLLSCAARSIRKQGPPHNSMLIHVTRYTGVQTNVYQLVEKELRNLAARIMSGEELSDFRDIWEKDYLPTTRKMKELGFNEAVEHSWEEIEDKLYQTTRVIKIKLINGSAKDSLEYRDTELEVRNKIQNEEVVPWEEKGLNIIAIGGDKLSRGLTLEGLTVSYYLRTSEMYDTLMQMGRWFGYRDGFSDLCRIYTTNNLLSWYRHIASATRELREEIDYMSYLNETPTNFGLKVRSHSSLMVTSAAKSRNAKKIKLSYSGKISETIVFDKKHLKNNMQALHELIKEMGRPFENEFDEKRPRYQWKKVPSAIVIDFLHRYKINEGAMRFVKPAVLANYIKEQNKNEELIEWDVVLVSKYGEGTSFKVLDYEINPGIRAATNISENSITIGRLVNPPDEHSDLSEDEMKIAEQLFESNKDKIKTLQIAVRHVRPERRGLLIIYIIKGECTETRQNYGGNGEEVVSFGISFPTSQNASPVEYVVNSVWMDEENNFE
ncbi:Z1 domain-containing protein [Methanolobus sp. WCC5]|uniref:Z1 domain-containing protein n=1 Tax=Methanolobus sp. WCC5 TaxID=3125785 RepID=UPI003249A638